MTAVSIAICLLAFASTMIQGGRVHQSQLFQRDFTTASALLVVCLGSLVSSISGRPGQSYIQLSVLAALFIAAAILVLRELVNPSKKPVTLAPLIPALVSLVLFFINSLLNADLSTGHLLARSVAIIALASIGVIVVAGEVSVRDFANIYLFSVLSVISISLAIGNVWRPCDQFKCGLFGAIYTGPFDSENLLGQLAVVGLLFLMSFWTSLRNPLALVTLGLILLATESRTSQIVFGAVFLTFLLTSFQVRRHRGATRADRMADGSVLASRPWAWAAVPLLALTATFIIAFHLLFTATPTSLSNRGNVWIRGLRALDDSWLFGLGLDRWSGLQDHGLVPQLYPHSEYLLMLFSGGFVAVFLLYWMLCYAMIQATKDLNTFAFGVSYILLFALFGLTEITWNPITVDITLIMVASILFILKEPGVLAHYDEPSRPYKAKRTSIHHRRR